MRDEEDLPDEMDSAWVDLVRDSFLLGLIRQLQGRNPERDDIEDVVYEAVARLADRLRKPPPVEDVRSYVAKVAYTVLARPTRSTSVRALPVEEIPETGESDSAEHEALRDAALTVIKAEVRTWANAHIREVTLVVIEAAAAGEPLDDSELTAIVGEVLGEELPVANVRTWKWRGLRKLRDFAEGAGLIDTREDQEREEEQ